MTTLDFKFLASISGIVSGTTLNPSLNCPLRGSFNMSLNSAEVGASYGDQAFVLQNFELPPDTGVELDLVDGLSNLLNENIEGGDAFAKIRFFGMKHEPTSTASAIRVGGAITSGAFGGLLTDPDSSLTLKPGQFNIMGSPTEEGMEVVGEVTPNPTTPLQTTIYVANLDPDNNAVFSVWLLGEKYLADEEES